MHACNSFLYGGTAANLNCPPNESSSSYKTTSCSLSAATLAASIPARADDTKFGLPEINFGEIPGAGGAQRLPRLVGKAMAKELMMTGKHIDGKEAERIGLVNHCVPREQLENTVMELAKLISSKIPAVVQGIKRADMRWSRVETERRVWKDKYEACMHPQTRVRSKVI
jgi:enoyl-CoA hydratase/carnithine racemase